SNLTGDLVDIVDSGDIACPDYWLCHTRQGVQFEPSMQTLARVGVQHCVELGPRPTLSSLGRRCLPDSEITWAISLRRGYDDEQILTESLAQLYVRGVEINFKQGYQGQGLSVVDLPTYPFQRKRYWSEFAVPETVSTNGHQDYSVSSSPGVHPLLGCRGRGGFKGQTYFESALTAQTPAFLADHRVDGAVIFPGAGYVEMALAAGQMLYPQTPFIVANLHLRVALPLPSGTTRRVQTLLTQRKDRLEFEMVSADADGDRQPSEWTHHVTGEIQVAPSAQTSAPALAQVQQTVEQPLNPQTYYQELERTGLHYGPNFQGIQAFWSNEPQTAALAQIRLPATLRSEASAYCLHPVLLDGCSQIARWADGSKTHTQSKVPYFFEQIAVYGHPGDQIWCYACKSQTASASDRNPAVDLYLYNPQGEPVAEIRGLHRYRFDRLATAKAQAEALKSPGQMAYQTRWQQQPLPTPEVSPQLDGLTLLLLPEGAQTAVETMTAAVIDGAESGVRIILSDQFEALPDQSYRVNMGEVDSFEKLLAHLKLAGLPEIRRILHLGSVQPLGAAIDQPSLDTQMRQSCGSTLHLVQALEKQSQPIPCELWLVTTGSQKISPHVRTIDVTGAPLWGLGRVIRSERPELHCRQIDLDPWDRGGASCQLLREIAHSDGEEEVAYRAGQRWVPRLVSLDQLPKEPDCLPMPAAESLRLDSLQLDIETRGLLDSLTLRAVPRPEPGPGEVEVEVAAAALNFRDVLNALGTYKGKPGPLGGEFAGRVVRVGEGGDPDWIGKRVLGLATGSFSHYVIAQHQVIAELPDCLSFEQGAAIPITFLTAYHTLYLLAALKPGERVLIHAGAGGVGLAAIQLAQRLGAEVFATAGSDEKRALLRSLGVQHVMNSRTTAFAAEIQAITQGEGIDVVLNSFTGEFIVKGLSLLRPGGRFIELGKAEIWTDAQVAEVNPNITYLPYYLGDYRDNDPTVVQSLFKDVLTLFVRGDLQVIAYQALPVQRAVEFFRLMQRGGHIGKLVLTFRQCKPTGQIAPEGTYLLTGGLGGIGLALAQRLVKRGVQHLALLSRRGRAQLAGDSEKAQTARDVIQQLEALGAQVSILQADVSAYDELSTALTEIRQTLPPLRGIFHAAGALEDGMLSGQTWGRFQKGLAAKVQGTWNLHRLSADDELDCFVLFSSVTAVLGPAARGPYAAANLFLDAMAHYRSQLGLPCLSVDWGAWANTGMAQEIRTQRKRWQKVQMLTPETGLDWLERLMAHSVHQIGIFPVDWQAFPKRFSGEHAPRYYESLTQPSTAERSATAASPQPDAQPAQARVQSPTVSQPSVQPQTLTLSQMPSSTSADPREESLQHHLAQGISTMLGLESAAELDPHQPLEVYGLDSLMTLELRNWLLKEFQVELPVVQLAKSRSIAELGKQLLQVLPTTAFTAELHSPSQPVSPPLPQPPVQPQPPGTANQPEESLQSHLAQGISTMLGLESAAELDPHQPLEVYGLDSLMTLELRNWLLKDFQVELPVVQLAKNLSILDLCERLLQMMSAVKPAAPPVRPAPTPPRLTPVPPAIAPTTSHANGHANGHIAPAESNGSTPGRDRYSFILNLRDLLYYRNDQDLTTFERLTKHTVRSLSGIAAMERIIQDYCAGRESGETLQQSSMRRLKLKLDFNHAGLENIPKTGPAVVVANHPFGYIDGAITEYLVSLRRPDVIAQLPLSGYCQNAQIS
ncbi:MAG: SDR family NAD(P)-dependent oxidoreductase, partial [Cyanobacteria bacterium J06635_1]